MQHMHVGLHNVRVQINFGFVETSTIFVDSASSYG